jgi:hypothetical protein
VAAPAATESADLEPAAVTHQSPAQPQKTVQEQGKSGKSGKPPGKGKGKGKGSES